MASGTAGAALVVPGWAAVVAGAGLGGLAALGVQ